MPTTPLGIRYPLPSDPADIPTDLGELASDVDALIGLTKMTTNGDLLTYSTEETPLPLGTDGQYLVADSAEATGLAWRTVAPPTTNGHALIASVTTAVNDAAITFSSIPQTYTDLYLVINGRFKNTTTPNIRTAPLVISAGGVSAMKYAMMGSTTATSLYGGLVSLSATNVPVAYSTQDGTGPTTSTSWGQFIELFFNNYTSSSNKLAMIEIVTWHDSSNASIWEGVASISQTSAVSTISVSCSTASTVWQTGTTAYLWGRKRLGL